MVVRAEELRPPRSVSNSDFAEICGTFKVPLARQAFLRSQLDLLVREFAEWMKAEQPKSTRREDRDHLKAVLRHIEKSKWWLERQHGQSGRAALAATATSIAPLVSGRWLNDHFPGHDLAPTERAVPASLIAGSSPRSPVRTLVRAPIGSPSPSKRYYDEDRSLDRRYEFIRHRAPETLSAILGQIESALRTALQSQNLQPGAKGGRKSLTPRHYLIMNLAQFWTELGKTISMSKKSDFVAFCEAVAVAIGWPYDGMVDAAIDAVADWRNRMQNSTR
jgi:hypothetical protein